MARRVGPIAAALVVLAAGCASGGRGVGPANALGQVLRVPAQYRTIQRAVDAAGPGDLVLISPGTYHEAVKVDTARLVIRGLDRNRVVLDGDDTRLNGFEVTADRVAIENLTVRRYAANGVLFTGEYGGSGDDGPRGWRASYVTASNDGLYGFYAFGARGGTFDHDLATGHPDSGIYVGQCKPCDAVVIDDVAEHNAIGYEATNATGVTVVADTWRHNRVGMTTGSGRQEGLAPQDGSRIVANLVADNDDADTPVTSGGFGVGIVVAGGRHDRVERNVVRGNPAAGIVVTDQDGYAPESNTITANELAGNGLDVVFGASAASDGLDAAGNCFGGNTAGGGALTSQPDLIESLLPCGSAPATTTVPAVTFPPGPGGIGYQRVPAPGPQPQMPGAARRQWAAPPLRPPAPDLSTVAVPSGA